MYIYISLSLQTLTIHPDLFMFMIRITVTAEPFFDGPAYIMFLTLRNVWPDLPNVLENKMTCVTLLALKMILCM